MKRTNPKCGLKKRDSAKTKRKNAQKLKLRSTDRQKRISSLLKTFSKAFRSFVSDCMTNMKLPSLTHVLVDAYDDTWCLFMIALHLAHDKSPFVPFNHVKVKTLNFCITICLLITNN